MGKEKHLYVKLRKDKENKKTLIVKHNITLEDLENKIIRCLTKDNTDIYKDLQGLRVEELRFKKNLLTNQLLASLVCND